MKKTRLASVITTNAFFFSSDFGPRVFDINIVKESSETILKSVCIIDIN